MSDVQNTAAPVETPVVAEPVANKVEETTTAPVTEEVAEPETAATEEAPAAVAAEEPTTTEAPVAEAPVAEAPATTETPAVAEPATEAAATEETPAVAATEEAAKPVESGILGYKAPGLIKSFKFSKKNFYLSEEPVSVQGLSHFLRGEKPDTGAHATAAWSSQTGKGLLYFVKHAEDDKKQPQGVLNLSEATDLKKASGHEFTFEIHHHKHSFKAANDAERDAWYSAIEKAIAEAKASKDTVTSSEGYKEALASLGKSQPVAAAAGGRKSLDASRARPGSSSSSSSSDNEEKAAKKAAKKSRSASRSKRTSIFGNFKEKKDKHDAKKEEKKEEKAAEETEQPATEAVEEPVAAAAAPVDAEGIASRVVEAPVEEAQAVEETPAAAPVAEAEAAPAVEEVPVAESAPAVEAAAVAAEEKAVEEPVAAEAAPKVATQKSEKPVESKKSEERPKNNKRSSIFGAFFDKVRSPTTEKKESEVAPAVPAKDTVVSAEPPVLPEPSVETSTPLDPTTEAAPAVAEPVVEAPKAETPKVDSPKVDSPAMPPQNERKQSFFGGIVNKVRAKSPAPAASTEAPIVPPKDDEAVATPEVEAPAATEAAVEKPVEEPVAAETAPKVETPKAETPKAETPKESRRKSYFGAFGGSKKTDAESPAEEKSALGKITGLFRTKSQAARGVKKENVAPTEPVPAVPSTEAAAEPAAETQATEAPAAAETKAEEPVAEAPAVTESQQTSANPTVSAAA